ncbi:MAG: DUF4345 family protein [Reichenbachiella sp.]
MEIIKLITLGLSGLLLTFVGLMRLTNPAKTYLKNSGIKLNNDKDLLNEIRGVASLMFCGGIIVMLGTALPTLTIFSLLIASLVFIGFLIGRVFSRVVDGKPNKQLITGMFSELILGSANAFFLIIELTK